MHNFATALALSFPASFPAAAAADGATDVSPASPLREIRPADS